MDVKTLTSIVQQYFREKAVMYGLNADDVRAQYILNWGGFVNASFTVTDGEASYHLKLTSDDGDRLRFRKWQSLRGILEERYHAPEVLAWVDIPETQYGGLMFRHVAGHDADFSQSPGLLQEVIEEVGRLHSDSELAERVRLFSDEKTCADYFAEVYIERFDEDLKIVEADPPPFVSREMLQWMKDETRRLEAMACQSEAFAHPAVAPVHGDLHDNNFIVTEGGRWFLVDWDDLALGDSALEYAILLWPLLMGSLTASWRAFTMEASDPGFPERIELCLRAQLLDEVIDVLADYVEAHAAPDHAEHVRERKRQQHTEALALYRRIYG